MEFTLADGGVIPAIGIGTWPMDDTEAERVIAQAIDLGYRLVDTAFAYGNEVGVGRGVAASSVPREDIFITTKFNRESHSVAGVARAWDDSVRKLGVDYLDLMLIHWPNPGHDRYLAAWEGLIAQRDAGRVRHIGVSNFLPEHIDRIVRETGVLPVVNQLQVNPRYPQADVRAANAARGIHTQAWSPLGQGTGLLDLPVLGAIADRQGCTRAQVVLAWDLALGMSAIPKSSRPDRLLENLNATEVALSDEDLALLSAIDVPEPDIKHPDSFGH